MILYGSSISIKQSMRETKTSDSKTFYQVKRHQSATRIAASPFARSAPDHHAMRAF